MILVVDSNKRDKNVSIFEFLFSWFLANTWNRSVLLIWRRSAAWAEDTAVGITDEVAFDSEINFIKGLF